MNPELNNLILALIDCYLDDQFRGNYSTLSFNSLRRKGFRVHLFYIKKEDDYECK